MLSIEEPSCSCQQPSAASDLAASGHDDDDNFSIRGYVFKSRSKDIKINWPFRKQLLQLCLDNGISDLLPPLESPSLVRACCLTREEQSKQLPRFAKNKAILDNGGLPLDSLVIASSDRSRSLSEGRRDFKVRRKLAQIASKICTSSVTSHDVSEGVSGEQSKKKCRFVAKPLEGSEVGAAEGLVSTLVAVADPMASKVCPVCKSFTSSSNTTLNAHIDQCLSVDQSNTTRDVTECPKPKVKPRKKRLMVDIYATASYCTLEDLDKRNGTNWAVTLAPVAPANGLNVETTRRMNTSPSGASYATNTELKRTKLSPSDGASSDISMEPKRMKKLSSDDAVNNDISLVPKRMKKLSPLDAVNNDINVEPKRMKKLSASGAVNDINVEPKRMKKLSPSGTANNDIKLLEPKRLEKLSPSDAVSNGINLEPKRMKKLSLSDATNNDTNLLEPKRMEKLSPSNAGSNGIDLGSRRMKLSVEGNVGDIYIDSNGTKLLILSKFNNPPPSVSRKKFKMKQHGKRFNKGQNCSASKKKFLKPKFLEFMKDNPENRKLSTAKGFNHEIEAGAGRYHVSEDHQAREQSLSRLLNAHDQVSSSEPSLLGHWVCSKRSDLSRKLTNKDINRQPGKMVDDPRKLSLRSMQPDLAHSSIQRSALNLPYSSEKAVASPKIKCINTLSNNSRGVNYLQPSNLISKFVEDDSLADGHMPRASTPSETCLPSLKVRQSSTPKKRASPRRACVSLEGRAADKNDKLITLKKFKKHRSKLDRSKRGEQKYLHGNGVSDASTDDFGCISPGAVETSNARDQSDFSENQDEGSLDMADPVRSTVTEAPAHDANLDTGSEEHVESLARNETRAEALAQRSASCEEAQCEDAVSGEVVSQDFQTAGEQAETVSHGGEFHTDAFYRVAKPCSAMESSGSAADTISAPSLVDDKIKDSESDKLAGGNTIQDKCSSVIARKEYNVKLPAPPREPSCSCSESLSREGQFLGQRKSFASNLFIRPPAFSSFQQVCPSLESRTKPVAITDSPKSMVDASTPCSVSQSASNPILRLMGKDLVVGKEESVHVPTILPTDTQAKFISFGVPSNVGLINYHNPYGYQIQTFAGHQIALQPLQRPEKLNSHSQWGMDRMVAPQHHQPRPTVHSYPLHEVILIDDDSRGLEHEARANFTALPQSVQNPNLMAPQRLFPCLPPQNHYASRPFTPSQRETSEGAFVFSSPSSFYFSPTLR